MGQRYNPLDSGLTIDQDFYDYTGIGVSSGEE